MPQRLMDYAAVFLIALPLMVFGGANPGQQETRSEAVGTKNNGVPQLRVWNVTKYIESLQQN
jgi:hypothetical protein